MDQVDGSTNPQSKKATLNPEDCVDKYLLRTYQSITNLVIVFYNKSCVVMLMMSMAVDYG